MKIMKIIAGAGKYTEKTIIEKKGKIMYTYIKNKGLKMELLNRVQAAEYLGLKPRTLDVWASTKRYDLKYIKVGGKVKYRKEHLDQFLESRTISNAEQK